MSYDAVKEDQTMASDRSDSLFGRSSHLAAVALEAGGWVVITVTDLPDHVVVGKPVTLTTPSVSTAGNCSPA